MSKNLFDSLTDEPDEGFEIDPEIYLQQLLNDPALVQHVNRTESEGRQTVVGYFRVVFQPGQQRLVLHVPFSPPLAVIPQVEAHALDEQNVRVRITDSQKYGLRAEVILPNPVESERRFLVEVVASEGMG